MKIDIQRTEREFCALNFYKEIYTEISFDETYLLSRNRHKYYVKKKHTRNENEEFGHKVFEKIEKRENIKTKKKINRKNNYNKL